MAAIQDTFQKAEREGLFSSVLVCADCGNRMHFCNCKNFEGRQDHYTCAKYKAGRGECTAHYEVCSGSLSEIHETILQMIEKGTY